MKWVIAIALLFLSACTPRAITVQHEYLDRSYLASAYVETIDPRQFNFCGEMLIIRWRLSKACMKLNPNLVLTIRFHNQEVCEEEIPIKKKRGSYCYRLMNEKWRSKGGILTYKVELLSQGQIVETFEHQVWVEKIEVPL